MLERLPETGKRNDGRRRHAVGFLVLVSAVDDAAAVGRLVLLFGIVASTDSDEQLPAVKENTKGRISIFVALL